MMNFQTIINTFKQIAPKVDFWSLRLVLEQSEYLSVRENIVQPPHIGQELGAHITLIDGDGSAYAATSDLSRNGFARALERALLWARLSAKHGILPAATIPRPQQSGHYQSPVAQPWQSTHIGDKIALLQDVNRALNIDERIVDWQASLGHRDIQSLLITSDGIEIRQEFHHVMSGFEAVANKGNQTQYRTGGGSGTARQGGLEQLAAQHFPEGAQQVAEEAIALLDAPDCPSTTASLLLLPSQMMLQIHESIGHPLELDRILGDERNYAGTSFVRPDMCGHYQYGSALLNITFDPSLPTELASYGFDDEGTPTERTYLIRNGILERLLGGALSQTRSELPGVANARASSWNRPPIDRMANLNLEPGKQTLDELVSSIEHGVLMDANRSWSIDDSRNKFQFGCELGRIIEDGEIKGLVKNPNYRGISANFWRNLAAVGNASTFEVWGTPNCGKGEPNQLIHVGHASPACVFNNVEIFGGD
ncbi:TldD/PmbA family protein [Thiothrix nivea]|uniref:Peptidase U62 modulator of DNA gyrase n=1 Tax=Thiothrix nivea (strain ATCC 35100 / DSM 5205 / JP2) TaxID=870187 RepID=A0A656HHF4_THINJ|nr:TldD/PmbA family protein [Thiothrix nivea]EIJ34810.1 peptidase U62 modulator of DNA gyrase [Thiothrix nivea DSM 5205]